MNRHEEATSESRSRLPWFDSREYNVSMSTDLHIDVSRLADPQRRALEEMIGQELSSHQRLVISVVDANPPPTRPAMAAELPDYCNVYDGLSDEEIAELESLILDRSPSRSES